MEKLGSKIWELKVSIRSYKAILSLQLSNDESVQIVISFFDDIKMTCICVIFKHVFLQNTVADQA